MLSSSPTALSTWPGFRVHLGALNPLCTQVGEIQTNTDPSQWKHIPSEDNVADEQSQVIQDNELQGRWTNGLQFLHMPKSQWMITTAS